MTSTPLPPNATRLERAIAGSIRADLSTLVAEKVATLWSPDTCPVEELYVLAWSIPVDGWSSNWTEAQQRAAIAAAIQVNRRKGTVGALRRALSALGYEVIINEHTGEAYTFRLQLDCSIRGLMDTSVFDEAERIGNRVKNVRSHLAGVDGLLVSSGRINIAACEYDGSETEILPDIVTLIESASFHMVAASEYTADTTTVYPSN